MMKVKILFIILIGIMFLGGCGRFDREFKKLQDEYRILVINSHALGYSDAKGGLTYEQSKARLLSILDR